MTSHGTERSLVIAKPDAVERGLIGEIVTRMEARGLRIVAAEMILIDEELAARHYAEHTAKSFYPELAAFIGRSPCLVMVVEGPEGTVGMVRTMMGATDPAVAAPGTIRGDLATTMTENVIHGSDSVHSASREIGVFFPSLAG